MTSITKLLIILLLISCTTKAKEIEAVIKGKVIAVKDGDTIDILYKGNPLTIRLAHIDCPEKKQPFGSVAKSFISAECFGQVVTIQSNGKSDRNKRLIGVVINARGKNVNKELVKAGLAWHFTRYSTDTSYAVIERAARQNKIGLWKDVSPTPPWQWRKPKLLTSTPKAPFIQTDLKQTK